MISKKRKKEFYSYIDNNASYKSIIKSTTVIGLSKIITIILRIIRNKIIAVMLGKEGMGLQGIYTSTLQIITTLTNFGIGTTGVQKVAEINKRDNANETSKIIKIIRLWLIILGIIGALITIIFSSQISLLSFGKYNKHFDFALLSITIIFTSLISSETAKLNGLRQIIYLAKSDIFGTFLGVISSIIIFYFLKNEGIIISIILFSFFQYIGFRHYSKKIIELKIKIIKKDLINVGHELIRPGFSMLISGLLPVISIYLLKILLAKSINIEATGEFHAAWFFSGFYLSILTEAMGKDFFPRISEVSNNQYLFNKFIDEQLKISLIFSLPLIVCAILFMPIIIPLLYSNAFKSSENLFIWMISASFFTVLNFPIGYGIIAQKKYNIYLVINTIQLISFVLLPYLLIDKFGIVITGISSFVSQFLMQIVSLLFLNKICNYKWSKKNISYVSIGLFLISISIILSYLNDRIIFIIFATVIAITTVTFSLYEFNKTIGFSEILLRLKNYTKQKPPQSKK